MLGFDVEKDSLFAAEARPVDQLLTATPFTSGRRGVRIVCRPELGLPDLELILPRRRLTKPLVPPAGHGGIRPDSGRAAKPCDHAAVPPIMPSNHRTALPVRSRWRRPGRHDGGLRIMRADRAGPPTQRSLVPSRDRATAEQWGTLELALALVHTPCTTHGHLPHGQRRANVVDPPAWVPRCRGLRVADCVGASFGSWAYACAKIGADRGEGRRLNRS